MPQDTESRSLDKVIVRLPDGMRDELKEVAAHNKRSMNAEIVARLEDYKNLRLDDIKWLKSEMERLRKERDAAEARLRDGAKADFETVMITGLPAGLGLRIGAAAQRNKRQLTEEVVQALEAAFPPPPVTFGQYMEVLRDALADEDIHGDLKPIFEGLLRSYETQAERDPAWANKVPATAVKPGSFPMNFRPADE